MPKDLNITFEILWVKEDPTGEPCAGCGELIFSKTNALYLTFNNNTKDLNVRVCQSCFEEIKNPE